MKRAARKLFKSRARKNFLFLLVGIFILVAGLVTNNVFAQSNTTYQNPSTPVQKYPIPDLEPGTPFTQRVWIQSLFIDGISTVNCYLVGYDPVNPKAGCLGSNPQTGKLGLVKPTENGNVGGLVGVTGNMISILYTPPMQLSDNIHYLARNFGFEPTAHAQTSGFEGLRPLQEAFLIFRNIAYLAFVFVFVLIGVAIMLRVKIDPRTVMTIQNQVPKIIIGLLLITFAYAIAGILIDLMYLSIFILFNILKTPLITLHQWPGGFVNDLFKDVNNNLPDTPGIFNIAGNIADMPADYIRHAVNGVGQSTIIEFLKYTIFLVPTLLCSITEKAGSIPIVGGLIKFLIRGPAGAAVCNFDDIFYGVIFGIFFLVFVLAIFIQLVRLWFILLKSYIYVLMDVVLAPLWIIAGLFPGSKLGFVPWLRHIAAHLAVYPVTIGIFLLALFLINSFAQNDNLCKPDEQCGVFVPPLIGNPASVHVNEDGSVTSDVNGIGALIAFGFIMLAPTVLEITRSALQAPTSPYTKEIGAGFGRGFILPTAIGGAIGSQLWKRRSDGSAGGLIPDIFQRPSVQQRLPRPIQRLVSWRRNLRNP